MQSSPLDFEALVSPLLSSRISRQDREDLKAFIDILRPPQQHQVEVSSNNFDDPCKDAAEAAATAHVIQQAQNPTSNLSVVDRHRALEEVTVKPDGEPSVPVGKFMSYDNQVDKIWTPFVRRMQEKYGTDPADLVVPSGRTDASLLLIWHYPPMKSTRYRRFGFTADPSNSCMRNVTTKLALARTVPGMVDNVQHIKHIARRFDTTSEQPYEVLPRAELLEYLELKMALYNRSTCKVALLLGSINDHWYRKNFPDSVAVPLRGPKYFGKAPVYYIEKHCGRIRRLVFSSAHPESWFYPMTSDRAALFDTIWNTAAVLSGRTVTNSGYITFRQSRLSELIARHPLETDWENVPLKGRWFNILKEMRSAEKIHKVNIPLAMIPSNLLDHLVHDKPFVTHLDAADSTVSLVGQMLGILGRIGKQAALDKSGMTATEFGHRAYAILLATGDITPQERGARARAEVLSRTTHEDRQQVYHKGLQTRGISQAEGMKILHGKADAAREAQGQTKREFGIESFGKMLERSGKTKQEYIAPMLAAGKRKHEEAMRQREELGEDVYHRQRLRKKWPEMDDETLEKKVKTAIYSDRSEERKRQKKLESKENMEQQMST